MDSTIVRLLSYVELVSTVLLVIFLFRAKAARKFLFLTIFLVTRLLSSSTCMTLLALAKRGALSPQAVYRVYFPVYWISYALEAVLSVLVVYGIFRLAMAPLKGLQTLGMLVFRWAAAISIALAIGLAAGPQTSSRNLFVGLVTQMQQATSILTLCLLLFVCFAIRPMGLSYKSRIFGVSLGLGLMAATDLMGAAWVAHGSRMYTNIDLISGIVACFTFMTWSVYFGLPEPKRRIIVLPTTSPFLRWNQISMALGDEPGFVAIGGIPPEIFAPAEIEVMRRASVKMKEDETVRAVAEESSLQSLTA